MCKGNNIQYDEGDVPTIEKINIVTGKSYILKDECRKYINAWNIVRRNTEDLNAAENYSNLNCHSLQSFIKY